MSKIQDQGVEATNQAKEQVKITFENLEFEVNIKVNGDNESDKKVK